MRTFVIGDIHGGYKSLLQVLEKSKFDYDGDFLICLGDVADGWPDVVECFDELMKIDNLVYLIGNHDGWLLDWLKYGDAPDIWLSQGGKSTVASFNKDNVDHEIYLKFLNSSHFHYLKDNRLFVHGGVMAGGLDKTSNEVKIWDRSLIEMAVSLQEGQLTPYEEVYIGHTTTHVFGEDKPIHACEVWNLDTGAGWEGRLTIMDIDTKEFWQSDIVAELYPNEKGRK